MVLKKYIKFYLIELLFWLVIAYLINDSYEIIGPQRYNGWYVKYDKY